MKKYLIRTACFLLSAPFLFVGCAHYIVNDQSQTFNRQAGYRFDLLDPGPHNSDSLSLLLDSGVF
jgi:hypothetical protein